MDENPYLAPQTGSGPARAFAKLLPLLLPVLLALMVYVLFGMLWETPAPILGR